MIRLQTFGALQLRGADGREILSVLANPKRLALLTYLAAARPGSFHRRDVLLALFWPELDHDRARASLRKAVHLLRQSLGADAVVRRGDEELGIDPDRVWCDAAAFENALSAGALEEAVELYRGDFLEGFFVADAREFDDWVDAARKRWRREAVQAAMRIAEAKEKEADAFAAASWARRGFALLPRDEQVLRLLLGVLDRVGDRAGALEAYEAFARQLWAEYEHAPSPETEQLIESIRARGTADGPSSPGAPRVAIRAEPSGDSIPQGEDSEIPGVAPPRTRPAKPISRLRLPAVAACTLVLAATVLGLSSRARIELATPEELTVAGIVDAVALPAGYLDYDVGVGEVHFGKYFEGQEIETDGNYEVLGDQATGPLRLRIGEPGHNLYRGESRVWGGNLSGVGAAGVRGTGPIAVAFAREQSQVGLEFARSDGGVATLRFYNRKGELLGTVVINAVDNREYGFLRRGGKAEIAGLTVEGRGNKQSLSLRRLRYETARATVAAGNPHRIAVIPLPARDEAAAPLASRVTALLTRALDGMDGLRAVAADSIGGVAHEQIIGASAAREIATRVDAGWFVQGEAIQTGSEVRVQASLFAPESNTHPLATADVRGPVDALNGVIDRVTRDLLAQAFRAAGRFPAAQASQTSVSLTWLRNYLAGEQAINRGSYAVAENLLNTAVRADPSSAMAHYRLSQAAYRNGRFETAREQALAAFAAQRAVAGDETERQRVEAWLALLHGRGPEAERQYRALAVTANDEDAWQGLAETVWQWATAQGRPLADVKLVYETAFREAPDYGPVRYRLGLLSAAFGNAARAEFLIRTAFRTTPPWLHMQERAFLDAVADSITLTVEQRKLLQYGYFEAGVARVAVFAGRPDHALLLVAPALEAGDREQRARALLWTAYLEAGRGRPRAALTFLTQLAVLDPTRAAETRELFESQPFLDPTSQVDAKTLATESTFDREAALPGDPIRMAQRYRYGLALHRAGRIQEARLILESFPEDNIPSVLFLAPAMLERARIHERLGDKPEAIRHYRQFLFLWEDAETELLPTVADAQRRLERLER